MILNEDDIIKDCQAGKTQSFGLLYDGYVRKIYDFIYYKTLHKETTEDLTSLTFTKAFEKINQYNRDKGNFSSWLYGIARNNVLDYFRNKSEQLNLEDVYDLTSKENPEIDIYNRLVFEEIKNYLNKLKPEQREILIMRLWENRPFKEIADILGLAEANCKMVFYRGINKLRQELALAIIFFIILFL